MSHPFFSAPHRVMFAAGSLQLLASMAFWLVELVSRTGVMGTPSVPAVPPLWLHAGTMIFGIFPFFIFGFLMTALPKWMAAEPMAPGAYLPSFVILTAGWGGFYCSLAYPVLQAPSLVLAAAGQALGAAKLAAILRSSAADRRHGLLVVVALALGAGAEVLYAYALAVGSEGAFRWAIELGLWACVAPVFAAVLHRMLPFFTAAVVRGYRCDASFSLLLVLAAGFAGHAVGQAVGTPWRGIFDALATAAALRLSWQWNPRAGLAAPMLAMLHLGALWLAVGMSLFAVQAALGAAGIAWGGLLPLHAVGAGFFASVLIGMATRVTLGHSGRPIGDDRWAWPLFWIFQGVVALRLAGEFFPAASIAAAMGWLAVFGLWSVKHLPMYFRPRPDGQPG
ncbi:MAG: NnrS family protein [Azonexus sp.]